MYSFNITAQSGIIEGVVKDSINNRAVEFASIRLINRTDSTFVKGTTSNEDGFFSLKTNSGKFSMEISFIGYKTLKKDVTITKNTFFVDLGTVMLSEDAHILDEAVVIAKTPDVIVKGDTIEYNAEAYTTDENALLQDILKNIPGVDIDNNGNLMANGKPVNKILVDGKEFFDNDIKMALANLPANMIKKLQLFKEQSETSKITGFRDGQEQQVLNLKTKEEFKQSFFGDARLGQGNRGRYSNKLMLNYMRGDHQLSLVGNMNNANDDSGFSGAYSSYNGIDENKNAGINFSTQKGKDFRIGGSIRYSDNENLLESFSNTETFLTTGNRISTQNSSSLSNRRNLNAGTNLSWNPDTLTSIYFRVLGGYSENRDKRFSESLSFVAQGDTTSGYSDYNTSGSGRLLNSSLTVGRKLNSKGRNLSVSLNGGIRNDNNAGKNKSVTSFSSDIEDKIIDQRLDIKNKTFNWGASASYVEPITSTSSIMLSYSYNQNRLERLRNTYKTDEQGYYTVIDTSFTRNTRTHFANQSLGLTFQSLQKKYEYSIGFNLDPSYSRSEISIGDSVIENVRQSIINYSPSLRFVYRPKDDVSINFNYNGSTSQPTLSQLSADTIIVNALDRTYGNPKLKAGYSNNLNIYYQKSNYETGRFLMLTGSFAYVFNQIANYMKIDSVGNTQTTYKNVNGNWTANIGVTFNTPLKNKKFSIDNSTYTYLARNAGFSNGEPSVTNNLNVSEQLSLNYRSDKFESRLQSNYSFSLTKNNLSNQPDMTVSTFGFTNLTTVKLPYDFKVQSSFSFAYNSGYSSEFNRTEALWNTSISKLFLKQKKGVIRLFINDILKDRNNVSRIVTDTYVSDTRTNVISRYFMISFIYRFNVARGKGASIEEE